MQLVHLGLPLVVHPAIQLPGTQLRSLSELQTEVAEPLFLKK